MTDYNALPAHKAWAFTKDEDRKRRENAETYKRLCEVCEFGDEPDGDKVVVMDVGPLYHKNEYRVISNQIGLDALHVALFCDHGNLCFGYGYCAGLIDVYTD